MTRHDLAGASIALVTSLMMGCEDPAAPQFGSIIVDVTTPGSPVNWDTDGYTVSVDGGAARLVAPNANVTIADLPMGVHEVRLDGLAPNCVVLGNNPRSVTLNARNLSVFFSVACGPKSGTLRVSTTTSGIDPDADGYSVAVNLEERGGVSATGSLNLVVEEGSHSVRLVKVAENCTVDQPHPRTAVVTNGGTVDVAFVVRCVQAAAVRLTTTTSGVNRDLNGYEIEVIQGTRRVTSVNIPANGANTVSGLAADSYTLRILDIGANCEAVQSNPRGVTLTAGVVTPLNVDIICAEPRQFAYVLIDANGFDIYLSNTLASPTFRLTTHAGSDTQPAWSPDGTRLVFTRWVGMDSDVFVVSANGTGEVRLTNTGTDHSPAWSPDGTKIAFVSNRTNSDIHVMNADGSGVVRLTSAVGFDGAPAWSPDGSRIAFHSERDGAAAIWTMNADGSAQTRLTTNGGGDTQPAWSPDGNKIAFTGGVSSFRRDLFIINADGSGRTSLTDSYEDVQDPSWSSTGDKIAFTVTGYYLNSTIAVISANGIPYAPIPLAGYVLSPAWRP